jgi:hypothetical protein
VKVLKIQTAYLRRRFLPELVGAVGVFGVTTEEDGSVLGVRQLDVPLELTEHGCDFNDILIVSILSYSIFIITLTYRPFSC